MIISDKTYSKSLRKLLSKVRVETKINHDLDNDSSFGLEDWIPEDLLAEEGKGKTSKRIALTADESKDFYSALEQLRRDDRTEYLDNKQLKDRLWFLVCDVFINRDLYKQDTNTLRGRINAFLSEICKPIEQYEAIFRVNKLNAQNQIDFWDCSIGKYDRDWLIAWGLNPSKSNHAEKALAELVNHTVIIVRTLANEAKVVVEKAKKKAEIRLKALQIYLSDARFVHDEDLLFELSELVVYRKVRADNGSLTLLSVPTDIQIYTDVTNGHSYNYSYF